MELGYLLGMELDYSTLENPQEEGSAVAHCQLPLEEALEEALAEESVVGHCQLEGGLAVAVGYRNFGYYRRHQYWRRNCYHRQYCLLSRLLLLALENPSNEHPLQL